MSDSPTGRGTEPLGRLYVGCGAFTGQQVPPGPTSGRAQADAVELAVIAEQLGFDSVWLGEHHFSPDGYTGALFPLLGAIAARTDRVTIGTRVVLGPLHPALLLAEDAAQVALLAARRFILGLGLGYRAEELAALGIPKRERGARLEEIVEVSRKAWTGLPFSHRGPTVDVHDLVVRPAPPMPPEIWLAGRAPQALARVARMGDGYVAPVSGNEQTFEAVEALDALMPEDRSPLPIATGAFVLAAERSEAAEVLDRGIGALLGRYDDWVKDEPEIRGGASTAQGFGVVRGAPGAVVAELGVRVNRFAAREHHLTLRASYPGMTTAQVAEHMELLAREVVPTLREIAAGAPVPATPDRERTR